MPARTAYKRWLSLEIPRNPMTGSGAAFLWGPRGSGKTTLLRQKFPKAKVYDLLKSDLFTELTLKPHLLREEILAQKYPLVIIDEVQKIPPLLDEIHWLLENTPTQFILCGSSARKLKRESKNLLGGRAVSYHLFPFVTPEVKDHLNLKHILNFGLIPRHYLDSHPRPLLKAYVDNYLKEEIIAEAIVRNIPSFAKFLTVVALTHGQLLNYSNVARDVGVSPSTVRDYYQILEDTLTGHALEPWKKKAERRLIETAKFYLFDVGIANYLHPEIKEVVEGTDIYGNAFEHFLIEEIRAYLAYHQLDLPLTFWRTTSGYEVDCIVGNMMLALEFKSAATVISSHFKGLRALNEEHKVRRSILVTRQNTYRKTTDHIEIMYWEKFCQDLWNHKIISA